MRIRRVKVIVTMDDGTEQVLFERSAEEKDRAIVVKLDRPVTTRRDSKGMPIYRHSGFEHLQIDYYGEPA